MEEDIQTAIDLVISVMATMEANKHMLYPSEAHILASARASSMAAIAALEGCGGFCAEFDRIIRETYDE